jgi:hypothetical protein
MCIAAGACAVYVPGCPFVGWHKESECIYNLWALQGAPNKLTYVVVTCMIINAKLVPCIVDDGLTYGYIISMYHVGAK